MPARFYSETQNAATLCLASKDDLNKKDLVWFFYF